MEIKGKCITEWNLIYVDKCGIIDMISISDGRKGISYEEKNRIRNN